MLQGAFGLFLISGIACGYVAKKKGQSFGKWGSIGFFIMGPLVLFLISVIVGAIANFMSR